MPRKKPNLLIFVLDTQRTANMSCYGYAKPTTPNIDAIAKEGVLCLNNISPGLWTLPSHASLWTGKHVTSHGADIRHEYLEPGLITLPQVLGDMGYETGAICANDWASHISGNHRGFGWFPTREEITNDKRAYMPRVNALLDERGEDRDEASLFNMLRGIDWIEETRKKGKPFFLFINCPEAHLRCWPSQPYRKQFLPRGISDTEANAVVQTPAMVTSGLATLTKRDWRIIKALNDGETASCDARLKIMFDYLRRSGLMGDTILIVTSDHGDELGEHPPFMAHVMNVYDPVARVPLILRYPRTLPARKVIRRLTQTHDVFPTVMDILGVRDRSVLEELQGVSILNHIRGKNHRTWALAEHDRPLQCFERYRTHNPDAELRWANRAQKAYYKGRYKYIWSSDGLDELYDLSSDPGERRNLAARDKKRVRKMMLELEEILLSLPRRNLPDYLNESPYKRGNARTIEGLRAWGLYNDMPTPGGKPRFD